MQEGPEFDICCFGKDCVYRWVGIGESLQEGGGVEVCAGDVPILAGRLFDVIESGGSGRMDTDEVYYRLGATGVHD